MKISEKEYKKIVSLMPILCVDGVVVNQKGEFLLVRRKNEPLKGQWWVPGGRVLKGEKLKDAFTRKMKEELGIKVKPIALMGFYDEQYAKTPYGVAIHTVSAVFLAVPQESKIKLDPTSSKYRWARSLPSQFAKYNAFVLNK